MIQTSKLVAENFLVLLILKMKSYFGSAEKPSVLFNYLAFYSCVKLILLEIVSIVLKEKEGKSFWIFFSLGKKMLEVLNLTTGFHVQ